ncbi:hypothetical protein QB910_000063 [Dabrowskivirus KKP3916]|uniref:Uncharacterized protein n=1 Tax=Alicyclobacillus phage KKP_3916 TaxID=3040651 RepID=A0AAT9V7Y1_9CAUD|nr:hypothetical protein QB910_000063 [Alicyclobacillus phage KKP 3916]
MSQLVTLYMTRDQFNAWSTTGEAMAYTSPNFAYGKFTADQSIENVVDIPEESIVKRFNNGLALVRRNDLP